MAAKDNKNGGNLGFEAEMFKAADKLRKNMEPSDCWHFVVSFNFLAHSNKCTQPKYYDLNFVAQ